MCTSTCHCRSAAPTWKACIMLGCYRGAQIVSRGMKKGHGGVLSRLCWLTTKLRKHHSTASKYHWSKISVESVFKRLPYGLSFNLLYLLQFLSAQFSPALWMLLAAAFSCQNLYKCVAIWLIKVEPSVQHQALGSSANCAELPTC